MSGGVRTDVLVGPARGAKAARPPVFVVLVEYAYEGNELVGAFHSQQAAEHAAKRHDFTKSGGDAVEVYRASGLSVERVYDRSRWES